MLATATALTGCPAPLPPVHAYGAVGSSRGTPVADPEGDSPFVYNARLGVNPLGYSATYTTDRPWDFGLGYSLEQMPLLDKPQTMHGPYLEVNGWPSLKPWVTARLGARAFGELLMLETDRFGNPGFEGHRDVGYGATFALAWEATGPLDAHVYKRRRKPAAFGYGRGAWGLFAAGSFRNVGDQPYFLLSVGASIRFPVTVADLATQ